MGSRMMVALATLATLTACGRGTEVNERWLTDDWSPNRECREAEFTTFLRDGSYTAPMDVPNRRAIGIWSYRDGVLSIGTIMRQERFRIERVSDDELRSFPLEGGGQPGTLYRC